MSTTNCQTCDKPKCDRISPIKNEDENDQHHLDYFCHGHPPRKGREDGEPLCPSCSKPYTYDPKRYPGGFFCENAECPAYQEIPAAKCEGCGNTQTYDCGKCGAKNLCRVCPKGVHSTCPAHGAAKGECPDCGERCAIQEARERKTAEVEGEEIDRTKVEETIEDIHCDCGEGPCEGHIDALVDEVMRLLALTRSRSEKVGEAKLKIICEFVEDDFAYDVNTRLINKDAKYTPEEAREMARRIGEIYSVAHTVHCGSCDDSLRHRLAARKDDGHQVG